MAATLKPSLPFGATEWSQDWSTSAPQTQLSWGTWDAPVASPAPVAAKTSLKTPFVAVAPAPLPSAAFVTLPSSNKDDWNVANVTTVKAAPVAVVQSPPVIAPSSFVDVNDASAWTVPDALPALDPLVPLVPPNSPPLSSPQRAIKLRQAGGNIEVTPPHNDSCPTLALFPDPFYFPFSSLTRPFAFDSIAFGLCPSLLTLLQPCPFLRAPFHLCHHFLLFFIALRVFPWTRVILFRIPSDNPNYC